jgi:hypothetical protein
MVFAMVRVTKHQPHLRPAAPSVSHPGPNRWHVSRAREHKSQLVPVIMTVTKSSAILTRCSTKSEPSGPECVAYFARKRAHKSVGPRDKDHDRIIGDAYILQHQE